MNGKSIKWILIYQIMIQRKELKYFGNKFLNFKNLLVNQNIKFYRCCEISMVLKQTNAESERSLSVNARIVTKDRSLLGEKTFVGIHTLKEAVWFFDPDNKQPEKSKLILA